MVLSQNAVEESVPVLSDLPSASDGPIIEVRDVSRTFVHADGRPVTALDRVSLSIRPGEFVCVIGRSGHGKTTLLQAIAGLIPPSHGAIVSGGKPITGPGPDRGVIFQKDAVFPWMRVADNVEYGMKVRGLPKAQRRAKVAEHLDLVGLAHVARSWPRELSGGMRTRVAIASVFANDPTILLADEPFGALDFVTRRQLQRVLLDMWARTAKTILFVTHDVDEALTLGSRVIVIGEGRVVEDRPVDLPRPRTDDVLARPDALGLKHMLLRHLGLEEPAGAQAGDGATTEVSHG